MDHDKMDIKWEINFTHPVARLSDLGKREGDNQCQRERGEQEVSKELTWS